VENRFFGSYDYSIDAKGRINMPARFRKALSPEAEETFIVCYAPDRRLRAYPLNEWKILEEQEMERETRRLQDEGRDRLTPAEMKLKRMKYETLIETQLDTQGRIALSPKLVKYAGLEKAVTLIGFSSERCIEICAPENLVDVDGDDFYTALYYGNGGSNE